MFYLSRSEQFALVALLALLVAGAGVLAYGRGRRSGRADPGPLFVEASVGGRRDSAPPPEGAGVHAPTPDEDGGAAAAAGGTNDVVRNGARPLSLNTATKEELQRLPGIGPVYAESIIAYRERLGREEGRGFRSVDELLNVTGIGARRLTALRDHVVP